jgi:hypothetical protein
MLARVIDESLRRFIAERSHPSFQYTAAFYLLKKELKKGR